MSLVKNLVEILLRITHSVCSKMMKAVEEIVILRVVRRTWLLRISMGKEVMRS
jgi:hypothetical protein